MIIDISRYLRPEMAVWPGDTPFCLETTGDLSKGDSVNVSTLHLSSHTGCHVDAPYHYSNNALTMEAVDLSIYWGKAQVVTVNKKAGPLIPADFAAYNLDQAQRLLIHSQASHADPNQFLKQYVYPNPELADFLGGFGIKLYGTDAPSVDAWDDPTLPGHQALLKNNIFILEGLDLSQVSDGLYELVALPLKIVGGDGSPIRAALRPL